MSLYRRSKKPLASALDEQQKAVEMLMHKSTWMSRGWPHKLDGYDDIETFLGTEIIVGVRTWKVEGGLLKPANVSSSRFRGDVWVPGRAAEAVCAVLERDDHSGQPAPQVNCTCGLYASKRNHRLHVTLSTGVMVMGQVALWGRVIEHETGFRAQYAYPLTLEHVSVLGERDLRSLRERYGIA